MYLFIDTAERDSSSVALIRDNEIFYKKLSRDQNKKSSDILSQIDSLCKRHQFPLQKLQGIIVVAGPGQFSSLRSGIAYANSFGYALCIPVAGIEKHQASDFRSLVRHGIKELAGKKRFHPVAPVYGKEPTITQPKK